MTSFLWPPSLTQDTMLFIKRIQAGSFDGLVIRENVLDLRYEFLGLRMGRSDESTDTEKLCAFGNERHRVNHL